MPRGEIRSLEVSEERFRSGSEIWLLNRLRNEPGKDRKASKFLRRRDHVLCIFVVPLSQGIKNMFFWCLVRRMAINLLGPPQSRPEAVAGDSWKHVQHYWIIWGLFETLFKNDFMYTCSRNTCSSKKAVLRNTCTLVMLGWVVLLAAFWRGKLLFT